MTHKIVIYTKLMKLVFFNQIKSPIYYFKNYNFFSQIHIVYQKWKISIFYVSFAVLKFSKCLMFSHFFALKFPSNRVDYSHHHLCRLFIRHKRSHHSTQFRSVIISKYNLMKSKQIFFLALPFILLLLSVYRPLYYPFFSFIYKRQRH